MTAAAILSPMLLLPAGGQEQEHQGQTQVSQMTLIAGERYPQQLHREMMINQVLENMHLTQSQMVRATMIHQGLVLETKLKILHQNMVQMWDKLLAVASLTERIYKIGTKKKQTKTFSLLFSFFYRYTYLSWVTLDRYITLATIPLLC